MPPSDEGSNIKYLQATSSGDRGTVDGFAVNEEFTADPITLGDEPSTAVGDEESSSSTANTDKTAATVSSAVAAPLTPKSSSSKSSFSTKKKAKNKYGY